MAEAGWEFWIDVGGTFTDCIAWTPKGDLCTHKLLSSGSVLGTIGEGSTATEIVDSLRSNDPDDYFVGYRLTLYSDRREIIDREVPVVGFCRQKGLLLERSLCVEPKVGMGYELISDEAAPVSGIRWLMGKRLGESIGRVSLRLGTTRGTNALLERKGARIALVTTCGFKDVLRIAYQNRPALFTFAIRKPKDLYEQVIELDERTLHDGTLLRKLNENEVREKLQPIYEKGIRSLAVCLMNCYANPWHESRVAAIAKEIGFANVSVSHELTPLPRIVTRGDTAVVDAYLTPVIRAYIDGITESLPGVDIKLMTSSGALVGAERFVGKDSILSGPAGGVVGAAYIAREAGIDAFIGFDMGGTSTDVCHYAGQFERRYVMEVNDPDSDTGVRVVAPMLAIETVAAGGGSICGFDGQKPVVGPRSAGADPGPACYGRGGPLSVTDINLFLGRILPDYFPFPLDIAAVEKQLDRRIVEIEKATGVVYDRRSLAEGYLEIANANMVAPIRKVSVERGYDVREYALICFGGAGAQHACSIARELGMSRVLLSPYAGVLSALGIGIAGVTRFAEQPLGSVLSRDESFDNKLNIIYEKMYADLELEVIQESITKSNISLPRCMLDLRYTGQDTCITVEKPDDGDWRKAFDEEHERLYGFTFSDREVEVTVVRMELSGKGGTPKIVPMQSGVKNGEARTVVETVFAGKLWETRVFIREDLFVGQKIAGPAIIVESVSTIIVEPGWQAKITQENNIMLEALDLEGGFAIRRARNDIVNFTNPDPIELELHNNHFRSIAEEMGAMLEKTAISTNVKERLDFSCAVFDAKGDLVVNAPHIPVHLGAMSECVKCLLEDVPHLAPGEVYVTNDPYRGGSHIPDVTVMTPVFSQAGELLFFTANRAHHAEIGGITPGSLPPFAKSLAEEGVLFRHFRLVTGNQSSEALLRKALSSGEYPSRAVEENIADINAQIAANRLGAVRLLEMIEVRGLKTLSAYMSFIQDAAANKMQMALERFPAGEYRFEDELDDGAPVKVCIRIENDSKETRAEIDFTGTGSVNDGNFNANPAIVKSAIFYCFRCLIDEPIPLNAGVLCPLSIIIPQDCFLNPVPGDSPTVTPAVGAGNTELSQKICDVIFGALGCMAASQGTMNNFVFGCEGDEANNGFGYYETIGGGAGAGPGFSGADAVHTHMTNTRLTDPEILESRYPVRLERFEIRRGSGGSGKYSGGNGIIRELTFLKALKVSLVTSRRNVPPFGLGGGEAGARGKNILIRHNSNYEELLPHAAQFEVDTLDRMRMETPGGGGFGR